MKQQTFSIYALGAATLVFMLSCAKQPQSSEQQPASPAAPASNAVPPTPAPAPVSAEPIQPLPEVVHFDRDKATLGEKLFFDKLFSADGKISCGTCHMLKHGGAEPRKVSRGIREQNGPINAPTFFNSAYNFVQFWDGRAKDLQEQAAAPVENPKEMGDQWPNVVKKVSAHKKYSAEFARLYPDGVTKANITHAIAEYEKYIVTPSRFDEFLRGKQDAITDQEKLGYQTFKEVGCTGCHTGILAGGNMYQKMGLIHDYFAERGTPITEADLGRFNVTKNPADKYFFKVPTLRNVELTAPYLHDGSKATLKETIETMGYYQLGRGFSEEQLSSMIAFLKSLTGTVPPPLNKKK